MSWMTASSGFSNCVGHDRLFPGCRVLRYDGARVRVASVASVGGTKLSAFAIGFAETVTAWIALRTFHSHGARGRPGPIRPGFTIHRVTFAYRHRVTGGPLQWISYANRSDLPLI